MGLKANLRSGVAAICIASLVAPTGFAETKTVVVSDAGPLAVSVAQAADFSRIEFRWRGGARMRARRDGDKLLLSFSRYAKPDMVRLRVDPPRWLKTAEDRRAGRGLEIALTLADDADFTTGQADGADFVNLFAKKDVTPAPPQPQAQSQPLAANGRPSALPAGGVVKLRSQSAAGVVQLHFAWAAPLGAAVFRRGEAVWIVFDTPAKLDLSGAPRGQRMISSMQAVQGPDFSAVRMVVPSDVPISADGEGATWTVSLGADGGGAAEPIKIARDETSPSAMLTAQEAGATRVIWLDDPVVGDRIAVAPALAPSKGLAAPRRYVDLALLASVQGLVVQPFADDLSVDTDGDVVRIGRPRGLALSPDNAQAQAQNQDLGLPQRAARPGLVDFENWSKTGDGGFMARYDALQAAAGTEAAAGKDAGVAARMGLARFLLGSELSFEAIGVLNLVAKAQPSMLDDAEFRGLRGAAKAMAGRYKEAETDFSSPAVADDAASSLWRGYIESKLGQYADARQQFAAGQAALFQFEPKWRARFAAADAEAALALGQTMVAEVAVDNALRDLDDPGEQLNVRLVQAKLFEVEGQKDKALRIYDVLANCNYPWLSAPATLHATQLRLQQGQITPVQAADALNGLRYRWRGDATELDTIRALGQIYLGMGRYREALETLRSAGQRMPDLPESVQIQDDLSNAFRTLFLDGQADGLQPIQALALFYDFKDMTPIGADGDEIVRKLARRLVDVDLLGQAADLLKYQADNRLDGVPRAEVDTDLATIQLMNRNPEAALDALNASRSTLLPTALSAQRRVLESRAWMQLGQYDHALEVIETEKGGGDVASIRAEVAWKQHQWPSAGGQFEKLLGDRWKAAGPLTPDEESKLLRAAVAYSLADDDASLARLRERYQGFIGQAKSPEALKVALSGVNGAQLSLGDFAQATADNDSFIAWVQAMKQRFHDSGKTASATANAAGGRG